MNNTLMHDFYNLDDLLHVLASSNEALEHKHLIIIEHVSIKSSHYLKEMHRLKKSVLILRSWSFFLNPSPHSMKTSSNINKAELTSTNSLVSLKADVSKPRLRGELERMKPKSMWMMWPSESSRIFPLCLKNKTKGWLQLIQMFYFPTWFQHCLSHLSLTCSR